MVNIQGYENYFATKDGKIFSSKTKNAKELLYENINGYLRVKLYKNGKGTKFLVHRIIALCYLPKQDISKKIINHKDGNKQNNNLNNLEWCDYSENLIHAYDVLKRSLPNAKLTDTQILEIRELNKQGELQKNIKKIYNVSHSTISEIINNKRYKNHETK